MSCDRARRLFGACWDDELTHAEREWLEGHLAACPRCRTEYDAFTRSLELLGTLPRAEAPPDLLERVLARSRHVAPAADLVGVRPVRWAPATAVAAAFVLVVAAMLVLPRLPLRGPGQDASSRLAEVGGGPKVAVLVPVSQTSQAGPRDDGAGRKPAVVEDDPFDHSADLEFILDPVQVRRGAPEPGAEGRREIISF